MDKVSNIAYDFPMKKLVTITAIIALFFSGLTPVFAQTSGSKSITGSPSSGSLKGASAGNVNSFSSTFSMASIPSGAQVTSASISVSQQTASSSGSTGLSASDINSGANLGSVSLVTSGVPHTHSFGGVAEIVRGWLSNPAKNKGIIFSGSNIAATDSLSFSSIVLNVSYTVSDTKKPVISSVKIGSVSHDTVRITWVTDEATLGIVDYGPSTSYGLAVTGSDYIANHGVTIIGLSASTEYHFRVRGKDAAGNEAITGDFTFKTLSGTEPQPQDVVTLNNSGEIDSPNDLKFVVNEVDGGYEVVLNWDYLAETAPEKFIIYKGVDERYPVEPVGEVNGDVYEFTDTDVEQNRTYFYVVRAVVGTDESADSNDVLVKFNETTVFGQEGGEGITSASFWGLMGILNVAAGGLLVGGYFLIKYLEKRAKKKIS